MGEGEGRGRRRNGRGKEEEDEDGGGRRGRRRREREEGREKDVPLNSARLDMTKSSRRVSKRKRTSMSAFLKDSK